MEGPIRRLGNEAITCVSRRYGPASTEPLSPSLSLAVYVISVAVKHGPPKVVAADIKKDFALGPVELKHVPLPEFAIGSRLGAGTPHASPAWHPINGW